MPYNGHVTCQIEYLWEESVTSRVLKNVNYSFFINEKLPGPSVTSGNVGPDRVSRRASHSFLNRFRCGVTSESRVSHVGGDDEGFPSHLEKESRN